MSFIVKGIDLPKDKDCINLSIYSNGYVYGQAENGFYFRINADAIQIPNPHGDIIDRNQVFTYSHRDVKNLEEVPAILEGEEK